jgi:hypothetical protein
MGMADTAGVTAGLAQGLFTNGGLGDALWSGADRRGVVQPKPWASDRRGEKATPGAAMIAPAHRLAVGSSEQAGERAQ